MVFVLSGYLGFDLALVHRVGIEFQARGVPTNDPRFAE